MTEERKPPAQARLDGERMFHLLMENVKDFAIFMLDTEGHIVSWNTGAERILGYKEPEIVGQPFEVIFTPDDKQKRRADYELKTGREVGRAEDERWHVRKNGRRFFVSGVVTPRRDPAGNLVRAWGGPGEGYEWPQSNHGVHVDYKGNVWIGGNGDKDSHLLKFTKEGKFLMQVGKMGTLKGSNDPDNFGRVAKIWVDPKTNEAYVADGYRNKRVAVLDADNQVTIRPVTVGPQVDRAAGDRRAGGVAHFEPDAQAFRVEDPVERQQRKVRKAVVIDGVETVLDDQLQRVWKVHRDHAIPSRRKRLQVSGPHAAVGDARVQEHDHVTATDVVVGKHRVHYAGTSDVAGFRR